MSHFEEKLRADLARRAEQMPVTPDLADLHARLDRVEDRRDTRFNAVALVGAAAVVAVIIGLAVMMTRNEPELVRSTTSPTTVPRLSDAVKQRVAIAATFDRVFEAATPDADRLASIVNSAGLEVVVAEMRTRDQGRLLDTVKVRIDAVQMVPPAKANVDFSITSTEIDGRTRFPGGQAVREGSEWKISRATFCNVIDKVGVHCPPAPTTTTPTPA